MIRRLFRLFIRQIVILREKLRFRHLTMKDLFVQIGNIKTKN